MQISGSFSATQSLQFHFANAAQQGAEAPAPAEAQVAETTPPAAEPVQPRESRTLEVSAELIARFRAEEGRGSERHDNGLHLGHEHDNHGRQVRDRVRDFGHDVRDRVRDFADAFEGDERDRVRDMGDRFRDDARDLTRTVESAGDYDRAAFLDMLSGMFDDLMSQLGGSFDADADPTTGSPAAATGEPMPRGGRIETPRLDGPAESAPRTGGVAAPDEGGPTVHELPAVEEAGQREVANDTAALDFRSSLQDLLASLSRSFETMFGNLRETFDLVEMGEDAMTGARVLDLDAHFQLSFLVEDAGSRMNLLS